MTNRDTISRFTNELATDLHKLVPTAYQSDIVATSGYAFSGSSGLALTAIINDTIPSNRAADLHADFLGADNLGASTSNRTFAALLDNTPESVSLSDAPDGRAVPPQASVAS